MEDYICTIGEEEQNVKGDLYHAVCEWVINEHHTPTNNNFEFPQYFFNDYLDRDYLCDAHDFSDEDYEAFVARAVGFEVVEGNYCFNVLDKWNAIQEEWEKEDEEIED